MLSPSQQLLSCAEKSPLPPFRRGGEKVISDPPLCKGGLYPIRFQRGKNGGTFFVKQVPPRPLQETSHGLRESSFFQRKN
jgi:hypothetical protein